MVANLSYFNIANSTVVFNKIMSPGLWSDAESLTVGQIKVSGKLPIYPSPKPTLTSHLGKDVALGVG